MALAAGIRRKLLELKFQEALLAKELGLTWQQFKAAEKNIDDKLEQELETVTLERLEQLCPECLKPTLCFNPETGEQVCSQCGAVVDEKREYNYSLPFDTTYALESYLATDKSIGGTLNGKALMRVLAKSRNGAADLGLRARHIRTIIQLSEPPKLDKALKHAYSLSQKHGLERDKLFNHDLGRNIRVAYNVCNAVKQKVDAQTLAETCFYITLQQYGRNTQAETLLAELNVDPEMVQYVTRTLVFLKALMTL